MGGRPQAPPPVPLHPAPWHLDEAWARVSKLHQPNLPLPRAGLLPSPTPCFSFNCLVRSPAHVGGAFWPFCLLLSFVSLIHSTLDIPSDRHTIASVSCFSFFSRFPLLIYTTASYTLHSEFALRVDAEDASRLFRLASFSVSITSRVRSPYLVPDRVCPRPRSPLRSACQCVLRRGAALEAFRIRSGPRSLPDGQEGAEHLSLP